MIYLLILNDIHPVTISKIVALKGKAAWNAAIGG